jgi:hypothetical protein
MNAKHTPGPWMAEVHATLDEAKAVAGGFDWAEEWRWQSPPASVWLASEGGITGLPGCVETTAANAHLIASAPDLLEALEQISRVADAIPVIPYKTAETLVKTLALAAIAKAKGGAQ